MTKAMQRSNIGLNRSIAIPAPWRTAPVQLMETIAVGRTDDGHEVLLSLGMLADGTNLTVLSYTCAHARYSERAAETVRIAARRPSTRALA